MAAADWPVLQPPLWLTGAEAFAGPVSGRCAGGLVQTELCIVELELELVCRVVLSSPVCEDTWLASAVGFPKSFFQGKFKYVRQ